MTSRMNQADMEKILKTLRCKFFKFIIRVETRIKGNIKLRPSSAIHWEDKTGFSLVESFISSLILPTKIEPSFEQFE